MFFLHAGVNLDNVCVRNLDGTMQGKLTKRPFVPPFDVTELADRIVILIEVAGMNAEDFNITLTNDRLTVSGVRHRPNQDSGAYHRVEIGFGEFRVNVPLLWSVQTHSVSATYREGFLRVDLPRTQNKRIPVVTAVESTEQDINDDS
jgi:HSP20 family protein